MDDQDLLNRFATVNDPFNTYRTYITDSSYPSARVDMYPSAAEHAHTAPAAIPAVPQPAPPAVPPAAPPASTATAPSRLPDQPQQMEPPTGASPTLNKKMPLPDITPGL